VSTPNESPKGESASGIERALDVLTLFVRAETPTLGVTEIADTLGVSKAVVHRQLGAFRSRGFVELEPGTHRYRLGPGILFLGLSYLDQLDVRTLGHETLTQLVAETNETATMSVRVGWSRVYVDQVTPQREVKMSVQLGRAFPLHAGASSKAMLAFLPKADREEYLLAHSLSPLTARTVTDPDRLRKELLVIADQGFAVSFGERDASAGSVAAPVFGHERALAGVISVSGPLERFSAEVEKSSAQLVTAARQLSQRLGYRALARREPVSQPGSRSAGSRAVSISNTA
jgi:IclR family transcriptional regulator, acetate operon repressor